MAEVESRAKDILFSDKNMDNIKMSRLITRQIQLIERLYEVFDKLVDHSRLDAKEVERIKEEYNTLIENYGAVIRSVTRIVRTDLESPSILQNADFSLKTIKELNRYKVREKHSKKWHIVIIYSISFNKTKCFS